MKNENFEYLKSKLIEKSEDVEDFDSNEVFLSEAFEILNDTTSDTLIKKKKAYLKFFTKYNITSISDLIARIDDVITQIDTSINSFFNVIFKIDTMNTSVSVGILELMLKNKIENDLRGEDEIINSKKK